MCQYYISNEHYLIILGIQTSVYGMSGGSIMIFHPYRKNIHNFSEFLIFSILAIMCGFCLSSHYCEFILLIVYLLPGVASICCIHWIMKKITSCWFYCIPTKQKQTETPKEHILFLDDNDTFPVSR